MKLVLVIFISLISLLACVKKKETNLNLVELVGTWSNSECNARFKIVNNNLVLISFSNNNIKLNNLTLNNNKYGIWLFITSPNSNFKASYLEGNLMINNYCHEPLNKISN